MRHISVMNVNQALSEGAWWLHTAGKREESRVGAVVVSPCPVLTTYQKPRQRVLFSRLRDANPFFHFFESLWMLAGHNDVAFVAQFAGRMREFSDDGKTLNGAYGYRWHNLWDDSQVDTLITMLQRDPGTRRAVLSMWYPPYDLWTTLGAKDVACNTHVYFDRRGGNAPLNMMVLCRSNDMVWGAYGANVVTFSVLQEYMANCIGCPVGTYTQMSYNFHAYCEREDYDRLVPHVDVDDRYDSCGLAPQVEPYAAFVQVGKTVFDNDLHKFMADPLGDAVYAEPFFNHVAAPFFNAHHAYKTEGIGSALLAMGNVMAGDWKAAGHEWLQRRAAAKQQKELGASYE